MFESSIIKENLREIKYIFFRKDTKLSKSKITRIESQQRFSGFCSATKYMCLHTETIFYGRKTYRNSTSYQFIFFIV